MPVVWLDCFLNLSRCRSPTPCGSCAFVRNWPTGALAQLVERFEITVLYFPCFRHYHQQQQQQYNNDFEFPDKSHLEKSSIPWVLDETALATEWTKHVWAVCDLFLIPLPSPHLVTPKITREPVNSVCRAPPSRWRRPSDRRSGTSTNTSSRKYRIWARGTR